jgi:hypothetical protein
MLRLQKLANVNKRRTLRAMYAQTQAYPYAATLDSSVDRTSTNPFSITAEAGKAAIWPGQVAAKMVGENVKVADADEVRAFGLIANFVGGEMDELGDRSEVGVWRGAGSVFEILAPVFVDTGLSAAAAAEDGSHAQEVYLAPDSTGRLALEAIGDVVAPHGDNVTTISGDPRAAARLVKRLSANAVVIELLV